VTVEGPDEISYEQDTILQMAGRPERFHHVDKKPASPRRSRGQERATLGPV